MALAMAPLSLWPVLFLTVPLLHRLVATAPSGRAAALAGWGVGFGYFVVGLHWIGHSFLVDAARFAWLLPFAVTLLPAYLAIYWGLAALALHTLWPRAAWAQAAGLAVTLTSAEVARAHLFTGFPWNLPGYAWVETPVMQAAAWAGPFGMTLLTFLIAGLPGVSGVRTRFGTGALVALALLWGAGVARVPAPASPEARPAADATVLRIVQANAAQHLKWEPGYRDVYAERFQTLSSAPPDPRLGPPDAVIWPEIALTYLPQDVPEALAGSAAAAQGATLLTGALFYEWAGPTDDPVRQWANALAAVSPDGEVLARYDKQHLVPWGEYLPMRWLLEPLGLAAVAGMEGGGFVPGQGSRVLDLPGLPPMAVAICYEMIFADEIIDGERPAWILHVTNDAWFGGFAGPQQHLAQARIRAIEQGLPVVRAAQTGISAMIDAHGRISASLPLGTHGALDAELPRALAPTLYSRLGDWPAMFVLLMGWGWLLFLRGEAPVRTWR